MSNVGLVARILGCSLVLALAGARPAAAVSCGQRIGPGEQVVLSGNLGCDVEAGAALVVAGPAELDLNGFSLACSDADGDGATARVGILLLGTGATVRNGAVYGCDDAVVVAGSGRHRLDNIAALLGPGDGIVIASDGNRIRDALAFDRGGAGFVISGRANFVADSEAIGNRDGFRVLRPATLVHNFANANERDGFLVAGARSILIGNRALGSAVGFSVHGGEHRLVRNRASENVIGIFLDERSTSIALLANVASGNVATGIVADGVKNRLSSNVAEDNLSHGVRVPAGASALAISATVARGNRGTDLLDEVPGCGTNRWCKNRFETRNQDCVQ